MATDLTGTEPTAAPPPPPEPARITAPPGQPHRVRFGFIYGALAVILVAAIVGVVVFASRSISPAPKWSTWKPHGGGLGAASEIATHVGASYHLPGGAQLVDVLAKAPSISPPSSPTIPAHYIAVRGLKGAPDTDYTIDPSNSVMYSMCGLGTACAIASGTPSIERGRLVRREILELALYTFKYAGGIQNVIAFMPPSPGKKVTYVVYLRRTDLANELKTPLATTLRSNVPLPKTIPAREVQLIDQTTVPRIYSFNIAQAAQGDLVFVLNPTAT
jgi:hypothetical protein